LRAPPPPPGGPGTELKALLASLGLRAGGCSCDRHAEMMDRNGAAWCRANRETVAGWLRGEANKRGWLARLGAAARAVATGLAFTLDPLDPFGSLVDEAVRRAEEKAGGKEGAAACPLPRAAGEAPP
jgi:hypothetical protein